MSDLSHAPPAKTVDGLVAVPVDITRIDASLVFDGATGAATGDATLHFITGSSSGNPIFDLRQTITGAWLDGVPLAVAKVAAHDFGGGPNAALRIVESILAAGSAHTLRVTYSLGTPQASTAGTYQPAMVWSAGPRLRFNFGFTDLGAGRYLEAWVPANLIYDQFLLNLDVQVTGTGIAHTVITNGTVTTLATNHWSISFPARFTALSPLLELRATDTLASLTDTVLLPVSGTTVTIELWKLAASGTDLTGQMANLKSWLADNEATVGPYAHGARFVAFLNVGGMEYEGGTTSDASALRHESYHSWWGRGVKPASQPDGWIDEAWTVYHDNGSSGSVPFDFTTASVELCPRNPWVRVTASGAYTQGERFFQGAAALLGTTTLKSAMAALYALYRGRTISTAELEAFLVARSGKQQLVDAFHRFVYGLPDVTPAPDLWIKDDPAHAGPDQWQGKFWNSPDLWIRNRDDGGMTHQPPEFGQDNWFYARVRNRGTTAATHFVVTFNVKPYLGVQFQYPLDFLPATAAVVGFDLPAGGTQIVKARWPRALVPAPGTHVCWLAAVLTRNDQPIANRYVWEHNNLAQKNLCVVDLEPSRWFVFPFVFQRPAERINATMSLELRRPSGRATMEVQLIHSSRSVLGNAPVREIVGVGTGRPPTTLDCAGALVDGAREPRAATVRGADLDAFNLAPLGTAPAFATAFPVGLAARVPVHVATPNELLMQLAIRAPADAKPGDLLHTDLVQRMDDAIVGGVSVDIRVVQPAVTDRPVLATDAVLAGHPTEAAAAISQPAAGRSSRS